MIDTLELGEYEKTLFNDYKMSRHNDDSCVVYRDFILPNNNTSFYFVNYNTSKQPNFTLIVPDSFDMSKGIKLPIDDKGGTLHISNIRIDTLYLSRLSIIENRVQDSVKEERFYSEQVNGIMVGKLHLISSERVANVALPDTVKQIELCINGVVSAIPLKINKSFWTGAAYDFKPERVYAKYNKYLVKHNKEPQKEYKYREYYTHYIGEVHTYTAELDLSTAP